MNENSVSYKSDTLAITTARYGYLLRSFFAGCLIPFGFAPFRIPGLAILGIALFYAQLRSQSIKQSFLIGFVFGLGFLGFGVSWVYVSIHEYGHLNALISGLITLLFVLYLALYPGIVALLYNRLVPTSRLTLMSCFLFSALWCLIEFARSTIVTGFPWLLLGFGQIDSPLKFVLPVVGVYGASFMTCLAATFLVATTQSTKGKRYIWLIAFIGILLSPFCLKGINWTTVSSKPLSVGVIQGNLSMRNKWDETLFWQLVQQYKESIDQLLGKKNLIVLPESAIPVPESYISELLEGIHTHAAQTGSAILLGIPQPTSLDETYYYNTLMSLGNAEGYYVKQHLVPFGEYIPKPFEQLIKLLAVPPANLKPGRTNQPLMQVHHHPIATLICYELAYPELLRKQLPQAEWIVSVSDDGWFGHSLAMYQQLQIAQALALQTGRYHVVSNNDGLSSIINTQGNIVSSLPSFTAGILEDDVYPSSGSTPWVYWGDTPVLLFSFLIIVGGMVFRRNPWWARLRFAQPTI